MPVQKMRMIVASKPGCVDLAGMCREALRHYGMLPAGGLWAHSAQLLPAQKAAAA
jgi:hypothetical protein